MQNEGGHDVKHSQLQNSSLDIQMLECGDGVCLVQCAGEVGIETSGKLREALDAGARRATHRLVVDLRRVTRIDSAGVGQVVGLFKRLKPGTRLQVLAVNPDVRMLLSMAGLGSVMSTSGHGG